MQTIATAETKPMILAPLRGITDAVFRNAFMRHFQGIDEAVTPFVTSIKGRRIKPSHLYDLKPADNRAMPAVPQILSNHVEEFICLANTLFDLGYGEVNWNLGCPYPMVARKMRGSGLLPHPDRIDRILDRVLPRLCGRLSIKTRLGRFSADEMEPLIPIFNRYPLSRVIIHPRTGVQMYSGRVDLDAFATGLERIVHPVVYNGDINDPAAFRTLGSRFPGVAGWMIGRGLVTNPFLVEMIQQKTFRTNDRNSRFAKFHTELVEGYQRRFSGPGHVLDRMKGCWSYFAGGFPEGRGILKQIHKAGSLERYLRIVATVLDN